LSLALHAFFLIQSHDRECVGCHCRRTSSTKSDITIALAGNRAALQQPSAGLQFFVTFERVIIQGYSGLASAYQSGGSAQALGGIIGGRIPNSRI
jgi:hypothetical protein